MKLTTRLVIVILGLALFEYWTQHRANAHPPCDDYSQEVCGYEMHVDPLTGNLESVYVCH